MAKSPTTDQIKRILLDGVHQYSDGGLASTRSICADQSMPMVARRTESDMMQASERGTDRFGQAMAVLDHHGLGFHFRKTLLDLEAERAEAEKQGALGKARMADALIARNTLNAIDKARDTLNNPKHPSGSRQEASRQPVHNQEKAGDDASPNSGAVAICRAVLTESLKRNAGIDFYTNLAVTELTGRTGIMDNVDVSKLIKNNEDATTFMIIRDGAQADRTAYHTVAGRDLPLTNALAIDAGAYAGYRQPDAKIAPSQTDDDIERTITQCYEENSTTSRKACFLAGARFGQSIRRSLDAAAADPSVSKTPSSVPPPNVAKSASQGLPHQ